jgi:hypothetical protein
MLTVKALIAALDGLDPEAQVVVGVINGPRFNAAYAEQEACGIADVEQSTRLTLREETAPALYICCYEQPRPWEGQQPTLNPDGTGTLRYDPGPDRGPSAPPGA